jgi:hypothetical protein
MFTIQTLIAIAVAGTIWQRNQARAAKARRDVTIPTQADDARDLVLR